MVTLIRTDSSNKDFQQLVEMLDEFLQEIDGDDHAFYAQLNKIHTIPYALVAYSGNSPVGCGALRGFTDEMAEIKRMFVHPDHRGLGIAGMILAALEEWAMELNFSACILETGIKQIPAIGLYQKAGYHSIPNYGKYSGVYLSVCMKKELIP